MPTDASTHSLTRKSLLDIPTFRPFSADIISSNCTTPPTQQTRLSTCQQIRNPGSVSGIPSTDQNIRDTSCDLDLFKVWSDVFVDFFGEAVQHPLTIEFWIRFLYQYFQALSRAPPPESDSPAISSL
eukprot:384521_1